MSSQPFIVKPGDSITLSGVELDCKPEHIPDYTDTFQKKGETKKTLKKLNKRMLKLQELLYAESQHALLIILQGMDTCGKDGTIRKVMAGTNVQGCNVVNFKVPSADEITRDFLWRAHKAVPQKGKIGIFNRSHYEDVLVVRVHDLVPNSVWKQRYQQINDFERMLVENGTVVLKFFLHISKDEQKERLESRINDPTKHWKITEADIRERAYWDDYMQAYEAVLQKCSTSWAPWYIIPANKKWYRNLVITQRIVETLDSLNMNYPKPNSDVSTFYVD
ncbi:MAG: polyphosphate kinase 2 family protein [Candidatus Poribacteria bacterium]|nr:polyphosphate kinase 2 family protein [Candidatus Poribacteria bacterium]